MNRTQFWAMWVFIAWGLVSCGGSGDSLSSNSVANSGQPVASVGDPNAPLASNELRIVVNAGPAELAREGILAINSLYASVTLCSPGSSACQTVSDVLVDTGSTGLRILASDVSGISLPRVTEPISGEPLLRCQRFLDGTATWGSVVWADVQLGSRQATSLPVHLIADPAAGSAPITCTTGRVVADVVDLRARGILGVSSLLQDCGSTCAVVPRSGGYYICPVRSGTPDCEPTAVPIGRQVANPIAAMSLDNNGLVVKLPEIPVAGAKSVIGSLFFGVETQANNLLGSARLFTLDFDNTFFIRYAGVTDIGFIDSGSNGIFFDSNLALCSDGVFYCPSSVQTETVEVIGLNNRRASVSFNIGNAQQLVNSGALAISNLGATFDGGVQGPIDLGLPFFFGRSVFVLFDQRTLAGTTGPAVGF